MIIYSSRLNRKPIAINKTEEKTVVVKEEVKTVQNQDNKIASKKKNNKKITFTPIVEEPIVVEEKTEDEDLSQWLKEHTED